MRIKFTIKGLREFINKLVNKKHQIKRDYNKALKNIGEMVVKKARLYVPEDKGTLKDDIDFKTGRNFVEVGVPLSANSGEYAYFIHYGRYKEGNKTQSKPNAGRLFLSRSIKDSIPQIKRELQEVVNV